MFDRIPPVNKALLLTNVGVFLLQLLTRGAFDGYLALWPPGAEGRGGAPFEIWQLLTYGFLHGGWQHLFFNMFTLYMFGSEIEQIYGPKRYLLYYLLCVVGAGVMHLIVVSVANLAPNPVVGASGGIFGILLAFGMAFPHRKLLLLFPPIPMPAWLLVTLYGLFELYMGVMQTQQGVAHFAHLGGMATGFVIIRFWRAQALRTRGR